MKKLKSFIKALILAVPICFLANHLIFTYCENKRERMFKEKYCIFIGEIKKAYYGRNKSISFVLENTDSIIEFVPSQAYYINKNTYPIGIGDSILVAKFESGEYQIILRREWIKKYNIPIKPGREKYIHMD